MKPLHCCLVLLAGLTLGMSAGGVREQIVTAQGIPNVVPSPAEPRFAISAWALSDQAAANPQAVGVARANRGCYIVDTVTGELWHSAGDAKPMKISEKLR